MNHKIKFTLIPILIIVIISMSSGCIDYEYKDTPVIIERENINEENVVGIWTQNSTDISLVFFNDHSFKEVETGSSGHAHNGTWRIENNSMVILTMETTPPGVLISLYQSGPVADVSFGVLKNGVLTFVSVHTGMSETFPTGSFIPETVTINREAVIGAWVQNSTGHKLVFSENNTFKKITNDSFNSVYTGTWMIENNVTLILTMKTYYTVGNSDSNGGWEPVSFGTLQNGILTLISVNNDPVDGFPAGDFGKMTAGGW